jgi:hypothetical protein
MPGARDLVERDPRDPARTRRAEPAAGDLAGPTITNAGDPRLARVAAGPHADLLRVQRAAGNAAVASLLAPAVQRAVTVDEVDASASPAGDAGPAPATDAQGGGSGPPAADSGGAEADHTITAGHIGLNAPIVEASGVIRAQTVIADSIVASAYTPGAGNEW